MAVENNNLTRSKTIAFALQVGALLRVDDERIEWNRVKVYIFKGQSERKGNCSLLFQHMQKIYGLFSFWNASRKSAIQWDDGVCAIIVGARARLSSKLLKVILGREREKEILLAYSQ